MEQEQSPEIDPNNTTSYLFIFKEWYKQFNGERRAFQQVILEQLVIHTHTKKSESQLKPHTLYKIKHKMDHSDKYNPENYNTFKRKQKKILCNSVR